MEREIRTLNTEGALLLWCFDSRPRQPQVKCRVLCHPLTSLSALAQLPLQFIAFLETQRFSLPHLSPLALSQPAVSPVNRSCD